VNKGTPKPLYRGPTDPIERVVADVNLNNNKIKTVWADGSFEADLVSKDGRRDFVNGTITLLHRKPNGLRLLGEKVGTDVFDIGSNDQRYWMIVRPGGGRDVMYWGTYAGAPPAPDELPIRPELLIEMLGVFDLDTDLTREPFPVQKFIPDWDCYVLTWQEKAGDPPRFVAVKEVWYNRTTKLPVRVILYGPTGRIVLRAALDGFVPLPIENYPPADQPKMATKYDIVFPDTGSTMRIELGQIRPSNKGAPNARTFTFPDDPGVDRQIEVGQPR
jgi:hypothetical protein